MKKIFRFFAAVASITAVAGGAFLVYKKFFANEEEDFDFDDSFEDDEEAGTAEREYVSINITGDDTAAAQAAEADVPTEDIDAAEEETEEVASDADAE